MLSVSLLLIGIQLASAITVNTKTGIVIGSSINFKGTSVNIFLGIPFAEPPVGYLRFKKTVPVKPWSEPLKAVTFPPSCTQYYPFNYPWVDIMPRQSEDCLYLNIWAPEFEYGKSTPKAVMFWIFSGGFNAGSNRLPVYDGRVLAAEGDVIVVTINYRLGIIGFLSTDTDEAPGNMGLFDILEALKWINNNIETFGGDKNRITLFGNSIGSSTAGLFTISPLSKGLFQRIIMESGSPLTLSPDIRRENYELGQKVATAVLCATNFTTLKDNPREVVGCLRTKDADLLVKTTNSFRLTDLHTFVSVYGDILFPIKPQLALSFDIFENVDVLIGNAKDDGSIYLPTSFLPLFGPYGELDTKVIKSEGKKLILKLFEDYDFKEEVADYYLSNVDEADFDTVRSQVYHSMGDFKIICPSIYFAEKFAERQNKVYFYYFEHRDNNTVFAPWMGTTHFTEVPFVFGRPLDQPFLYTGEEVELSKRIIESWTNFAKTGIPYATWKQFSRSNPNILRIFINYNKDAYLQEHRENCEFYRPYFKL